MVTGVLSVCVYFILLACILSFFLSVTLILLIFPCSSVGKSVHPYCLTAAAFDFPGHVGQVSLLSDNNLYLSNLKGSEGKVQRNKFTQKCVKKSERRDRGKKVSWETFAGKYEERGESR